MSKSIHLVQLRNGSLHGKCSGYRTEVAMLILTEEEKQSISEGTFVIRLVQILILLE